MIPTLYLIVILIFYISSLPYSMLQKVHVNTVVLQLVNSACFHSKFLLAAHSESAASTLPAFFSSRIRRLRLFNPAFLAPSITHMLQEDGVYWCDFLRAWPSVLILEFGKLRIVKELLHGSTTLNQELACFVEQNCTCGKPSRKVTRATKIFNK